MKTLGLLFALCVTAIAQTPVTSVTVTANKDGGYTVNNPPNKTVVLVAGTNMAHDDLFNASGMRMSFTSDPISDPKVSHPIPAITFVQFADGSTEGDPMNTWAQVALKLRTANLAAVEALSQSANADEFTAALATQPDGQYVRILKLKVKNVGATATLVGVKKDWEVAQQRSSLWKF